MPRPLLALLALVPALAAADPRPPTDLLPATVARVVDGDTIVVRIGGHQDRVRLIGVDTPELHESRKLERDAARTHARRAATQALGQRASDFARSRLDHQRVGLELDVEQRDRYGRLLAYVWLADGTLFDATLVREGYAQVLTVPPNVRYAALFRTLEHEAREAGRGLWGEGMQSTPAPVRHRRRAHRRASRISRSRRAKIFGPSPWSADPTCTAAAPFASARRTS